MTQTSILDQFTWIRFAFCAAFYTFFAFASVGFRSGMAFSSRNTVPRSTILRLHLQYLAVLLLLFWATASLYPHVPGWMTEEWIHISRSRDSYLSLLFFIAIVGMIFSEHNHIYLEADDQGEPAQ
jgi:hypothetical protein